MRTFIKTIILLNLTLAAACTATWRPFSLKSQDGSKKILHAFRTEVFKTLDPPRQFDNASSDLLCNIYDTLLEYSRFKRPYELKPLLLTRMPELQKDRLSYLFTLKAGVKFHDDPGFPGGKGRELTTDDVIFSIKRFADAKINDLSYNMLQGLILGLDDFRRKTEQAPNLDYDSIDVPGLKKLDDHRFIIEFTSESPLVMHVFTFSGLSILSRDLVTKYGPEIASHPVGTGAFYVKEFAPAGNFVLARNPNYHQNYPDDGSDEDRKLGLLDDAGKPMPFIDEIHLPLILESREADEKFLKGELDTISLSKDLFAEMAYKDDDGRFYLKRKYQDQYALFFETQPSIGVIKFNMADQTLGRNQKLRQALAYATDSASAIDLLNNGRGIALDSIVPPTIMGHGGMLKSPKWMGQDLWKASELLKEAGYPRGKGLPELTMEFNSASSESRRNYDFIRSEWAKIGVNLKANFQPFNAFLKKVESGDFQIANGGWVADYPDAESFYGLLYSKNKAPGPNEGLYANKDYDRLYEKIRLLPNSEERYQLFTQMNKIILDDCPVILLDAQISVDIVHRSIRNFKMNGLGGKAYKYLDISR